ncbi:unnamed protein product [Phaedon cochleariae]|uniref:Nibrin n=1 Tax=Phaedon cochleariae TaxID=80249 RepID=A0A9P0DP35_PHACE|nr:unnamed protein product [Phaedon cochleariae]
MLFLLKNDNTGAVFYLINQTEFIVGRRDCNILIENDQSISRKHAKLLIKNDHVTLEDLGSKYKTTHRGKELPPNTEIQLKNNDKIHFGVMESHFTFQQLKLVTTGTRLNSTQKAKLKQDLAVLGARFIDQWTADCTHLTVEEITLTVKVLQALIYKKPIVLPSYWTKFAECVSRNSPPPDIENYNNPPMAEALLNKVEIKANLQRNGLFEGKMFIFSKEITKKQMEDVIKKLGGNAISWEKDPFPIEDIAKSPKEFLVIQTPEKSEAEDSSMNEIIKLLSKQGKRTIPLQEIAMAIVHASCEKDCNPKFNRAVEVFQTTRPREPTQNNALVPNTESEQFDLDICKRAVDVKGVIPDTFEGNWDVPPIKIERKKNVEVVKEKTIEKENISDSSKRTSNEQTNENPFKKMKMEKEKTVVLGSGKETHSKKQNKTFMAKPSVSEKRKAEEDLNTTAKKEGNINPFAKIIKKSRRDPEPGPEVTTKNINPFSLLKKSNENVTQVSDNNPFKVPSRKMDNGSINQDTSIFTSTRIEDRSPEKKMCYSKISKSNSWDLNSTWLSKKSSFEIKKEQEDYYDTEMQSFIDSFKNKVVVEVMASISIRPRITRGAMENVVSSGVRNFKRFKKILPLNPQHRIIGKENFVAVTPGDTTGINDTRRNFQHDSDDESVTKVSKKRPPKKFFI